MTLPKIARDNGPRLFVVGLLAAFSAWYAWRAVHPDSGSQLRFRSTVHMGTQRQTRRIWHTWSMVQTTFINHKIVALPAYGHLIRGDKLLLLDGSNYKMVRLDPSGELDVDAAFGKELVDSHSSFIPITDLASENGNRIWFCNPNRGVATWEHGGTIEQPLPLNIRPMRLTAARNRIFMTLANSDQAFAIYDNDGRLIQKFGEFVERQRQLPLLLDGAVAVDSEKQAFFFAPRYEGFLASYSLDGAPNFLIKTVDEPPLPLIPTDETGVYRHAPLSIQVASLSAFEGKLYVLINEGNADQHNSFFDVYDERDGSYLFSSKMNGRYSQIIPGETALYALGQDGIEIWRAHQ